MLSGSHANAVWLEGFTNRRMAQNIIGRSGLFDEPTVYRQLYARFGNALSPTMA